MILADTNIYLEILLKQDKSEACKDFLSKNFASLFISDFSLHSIGVILLKTDKIELFRTFLNDTLPNVRILSLPTSSYALLADFAERFHLDFDDAYQYTIAKEFQLKIATMDQHFRNVDDLETIFI